MSLADIVDNPRAYGIDLSQADIEASRRKPISPDWDAEIAALRADSKERTDKLKKRFNQLKTK